MTEIVPHWKIGPQLLCGRMDAVMKNLFFNLKLHLFLFWRSRPIFNVIIGFPTQKKYKGANFHEDWPDRI